jgi:glutathione S-transferase
MAITLYHHPFSRAATVVWMLEEVGVPYQLAFVDLMTGAHKAEGFLAKNPMGKLPTLDDDGTLVTETAAIGLYLADHYAAGRLAPALDDPARAPYLRWSVFAPSVIEPAAMAKLAGWEVKASQAGWGTYDAMVASVEAAIGDGPFLLGERFTMADVIFGGTVRYMLRFKMIDARPRLVDYVARLEARPTLQAADAKNAAVIAERGLGR